MEERKRPDRTPGGTVRLETGEVTREPSIGDDATLSLSNAPTGVSAPRPVDPDVASSHRFEASERYSAHELIGEGGMGEVHSCRDGWVGRQVAMKVIRGESAETSDVRARFLREARVQGQLEHPSIVPVYDIGVRDRGRVYFTMKRVKGRTLSEIVSGIAKGNEALAERYSRRRLLSAMANVCLAVSFAHARGVVHRDLKPANVMLGDFGEVYVLDWGIAKIGSSPDSPEETTIGDLLDEESSPKTRMGALLGTPGYMAPEHVETRATASPAQDVYALGAILYEVLAHEPLHRGNTLRDVLTSTTTSPVARPGSRAPHLDIPPELDDICAQATAADPGARPSARELEEAIQRYLDGERDAERRHALAEDEVRAAEVAMRLAEALGPDAEAHRARAMRALTRALALESTHVGALRSLLSLLGDAPESLPPEAEHELAEVNRKDRARAMKIAAFGFGSWVLGMPFLIEAGVKSWGSALMMDVTLLVLCSYLVWMWRTGNTTPRFMRWSIPIAFLAIGELSVLFGPYILVPGGAAAMAAVLIVALRATKLTARVITLFALGSFLVPAVLQLLGWFPQTYSFENGVMTVRPYVADVSPGATVGLLLFSSVLVILIPAIGVRRSVAALVEAERRTFARAWRLRQLLPPDVEQAK